MIAPCRLYLTADKTTVVLDGDERAAFLLCIEGETVPDGFDVPTAEKNESAPIAKAETKPLPKSAPKTPKG